MAGELIVFVTCPATKAEEISLPLIEEGLAACVNILPQMTSIFKWAGEICKEQEKLLMIKTHKSLWQKLEKRIQELHSYEIPEIIAIPIEDGYKAYLKWIHSTLALGNG